MEACLSVEREHEKVVKKLRTVSGSATEKLQRVLDQIEALKNKLMGGRTSLSNGGRDECRSEMRFFGGSTVCVRVFSAAPGTSEVTLEQSETVRQCLCDVKEAAQTASNDHKDMHATISKLGKAIDKVHILI